MADNVAITAGTGTTVAADEVSDGTLGSCKVQYIKIMDGTLDGTSKAAVGANGLACDVKAAVISSGTITTVSAVTAITNALPAGSNVIGHVIADTGSTTAVTGNVTVVQSTASSLNATVVGTGTFATQATCTNSGTFAVQLTPGTSGGLSVGNFTSGDSFTALTNSAQVIKASAGQLYGYYIYNPNTAASYVIIYNVAAASVTVGTTNPYMVICVPAGSAANLSIPQGIVFSNAGWSIAAATTGGGNSAPTTALEAMVFYN